MKFRTMPSVIKILVMLFAVLLLRAFFVFSLQDVYSAAFCLKYPLHVTSRRVTLNAVRDDESNSDWPKYLRWNDRSSSPPLQRCPMELQTRVVTFHRRREGSSWNSTIQLHAQFHFADHSDYYNLSSPVDTVFFELLLDESLLQDVGNGKRQIKDNIPVKSSLADQQVARQYGWICQVDATHYQQDNWYHADFTRQEFLRHLQFFSPPITAGEEDRRPLWLQAARTDRWSAAYEATTALWTGPPMVLPPQSSRKSAVRRRIFTHLFLPGDTMAFWLRSLLWITVPCPELSVLLLDWSSYWFVDSPLVTAQSRISPILIPLLQSALGGRWQQVRQLVFGQVAVAGHAQPYLREEEEPTLLIQQRNDRALQQVFAEFDRSPNQTLALLYGCHHCPGLHQKLVQAGFQESQSQWRTAWSVPPPSTSAFELGNGGRLATANTGNLVGYLLLLVLPLYFLIGGLDWMETMLHAARSFEDGGADATILLYLLRHVFLYLGLSKLVLDGETIRI